MTESNEFEIEQEVLEEGNAQFLDNDYKMATAIDEFSRFASSRGCKLDQKSITNFFVSLTTSKLIITSGISNADFNKLVLLLSEYFESDACIDSLKNGVGSDSLLFNYDFNGETVKKNVFSALSNSANNQANVHIAAFTDGTCVEIAEYFTPFMKYLTSAKEKNDIVLFNESGNNIGYTVPNNLWFAVNLADGESVDKLPLHVARVCAVVNIGMSAIPPSTTQYVPRVLNRHQIRYMLEREYSKNEVSEDIWKKIDKFEKYVSGIVDFRIGNKLWLAFERQLGMLLSCNTELGEAIDAAIAVKLLPAVSSALRGNISGEDQTVSEALDFIFGEDNTNESKAFLAMLSEDEKEEVEQEIEQPEQAAVVQDDLAYQAPVIMDTIEEFEIVENGKEE